MWSSRSWKVDLLLLVSIVWQCLSEKAGLVSTCTYQSRPFPCVPALFSDISSTIASPLSSLGNGCESSAAGIASGRVVVAYRGQCSFEQKARVAEAAGAKSLLILSYTDDLVPPGAADPAYRSSIPVVMAAASSFESEVKSGGELWIHVSGNMQCLTACFTLLTLSYGSGELSVADHQ